MKIVCLSDTHNLHDKIVVPDGDVVVHAGDATMMGSIREVNEFLEWYDALPHRHKIFVAGNHDFLFQDDPTLAGSLLMNKSIIYLQDNEVTIGGVCFYGSPWQPWFHDWAFNLDRNDGSLARKWAMIPDDVNVLIIHGPPMDILDRVEEGDNVGCYALADRIKDLKELKLAVFGHIHESYGTVETPNTIYVNASNCNRNYKAVNDPIVVEI